LLVRNAWGTAALVVWILITLFGRPSLLHTPAIAAHRSALLGRGLRLADPAEAAVVVETTLTDERTGQAWVVQAGRPSTPVDFPAFPLVTA
jgi:hypothetical protein